MKATKSRKKIAETWEDFLKNNRSFEHAEFSNPRLLLQMTIISGQTIAA